MIGAIASRLAKPEYVFRPAQLLRRLARAGFRGAPALARVMLPWKYAMSIAPRETIGAGLWRAGVHELVVSEVLWRLVDRGEWAVDIGANSGYFTSLLAARVGANGRVWAFEPHPGMRGRLEAHVAQWRAIETAGRMEVLPFALSDADRSARLLLPPTFATNSGMAYLGTESQGAAAGAIEVEARRLDGLVTGVQAPAVLKIDVEGHEARVLEGASGLLSRGSVRDIVFEEHAGFPADSTRLLQAHGFTLFRLARTLLRPALVDPRGSSPDAGWQAPNFLATRDPRRARARMRELGWKCLSGS